MSDTATGPSHGLRLRSSPIIHDALSKSSPAELAFARYFLAKSGKLFTAPDPDLDLKAHLRKIQRVILRIQAAANDGTPDLFVHDESGALWIDGLKLLAENARLASFKADARIVVEPEPDVCSLQTALDEVSDEFTRLRVAIENNGADAALSQRLTEHFIRENWRIPRSRPAAVSEIDLILSALQTRPKDTPTWFKRFIARFKRVKQRIEQSYDGRQKPTATKTWADEVQIAVLALDIALGEFLSYAATTATPTRFTQFVRVIAPHHLRTRTRGASEVLSAEPVSSDLPDGETGEARGQGLPDSEGDNTDAASIEEEELDAEVEEPEIGPED